MRAQPGWIEALEGRRVLSVSIGSVAATPLASNPAPRVVARGEKVRLTTRDVTTSPFDGVRSVTYFIDSDGDGSFGTGDVLLGRARNPANNFSVTTFLKRASSGDTLTVSAVPQGLEGDTDFGPATTRTVTLPPVPAGLKSNASTSQDKEAARAAAAQADAAELQGLEFEQQTNDLAAPSLAGNDGGVLSAANG